MGQGQGHTSVTIGIDIINVCNVYIKKFNKRVCYFVNVYYFNKRHIKCRKSFVE